MRHICEIWVRDKRGRIRAYRKIKKALILRNFGAGFAAWFKLLAGQYLDTTTYSCRDTAGTLDLTFGGAGATAAVTSQYNEGRSGLGAFGRLDVGIELEVCAGDPPTPTSAAIDNYALDAEFGTATCGPVAYSDDVATGKIRVSVTGSISITYDTSVSEVGLKMSGYTTDGVSRTFLICRDVPATPISVTTGQTLTIKYTWVFN